MDEKDKKKNKKAKKFKIDDNFCIIMEPPILSPEVKGKGKMSSTHSNKILSALGPNWHSFAFTQKLLNKNTDYTYIAYKFITPRQCDVNTHSVRLPTPNP